MENVKKGTISGMMSKDQGEKGERGGRVSEMEG